MEILFMILGVFFTVLAVFGRDKPGYAGVRHLLVLGLLILSITIVSLIGFTAALFLCFLGCTLYSIV